ncbi:MAG: hypothetical protein JEY94_17905 [Melioribacteraceae bacterium]|nr:hypothetical protein [Melioribacteraceae bacterium]
MNKRLGITLLIGLGLAFVSFFLWQYVFLIYEVTYKITPEELYFDNETIMNIEVIPLNSFGKPAPFRSAPSKFFIDEGIDYIKIIETNENEGFIKIKAVKASGKVVLTIKSIYGLFPTTLVIPVYSNNT